MNVESKLNTARNLLNELGNALSALVNTFPDIFQDPALQSNLKDFQKAHQEATQRLAYPSLYIATIGTTSSGKSTIVNALIGTKIAPMEAQEMSAGVLTIKHSQQRKLVIEKTPDAAWQTGEWTNLDDESFYHRTQEVMKSYHQARQKQEYVSPQLQAYLPLFPICDRSISGLPKGIDIVFLDLPGLKSIQDKNNLAIIQKQVGKSFSLVALDYSQTDEKSRQQLLIELKKVVEYLQGRTDSMIFILNRVDRHTSVDESLEERIIQLKNEIKGSLNLSCLPDVIPFNALILYYAQCAWGTNQLEEKSEVIAEHRLTILKELFKNCANTIEAQTEKDYSLNDKFTEIRMDVQRERRPIDDDTMKLILSYAYQWSGVGELWNCIQTRLRESISELVIIPALYPIFNEADILLAQVDFLAEIRQTHSKKEVEDKIQEIKSKKSDLKGEVDRISGELKKGIKEITNELKVSKADLESIFIQELDEERRKVFQQLINAVEDIKKDLNISLITPVQEALSDPVNSEVFGLEEKLKEVISPNLARDVARGYDKVKSRLAGFKDESGYLIKEVKEENGEDIENLEKAERAFRYLYSSMKKALKSRAEFIFQTKVEKIKKVLSELIEKPLDDLKNLVSNKISFLQMDEFIMADLYKSIFNSLPELPSNFLQISDPIQALDENKKENIGKVLTDKTEGSCFDKRPIYENIYQDVKYKKLSLPNPNTMSDEWLKGISAVQEDVWCNLCRWINDNLDYLNQKFTESVEKVIDEANQQLNKQLHIINNNFEQEMRYWTNIKLQKEIVSESYQKLKYEFLNKEKY